VPERVHIALTKGATFATVVAVGELDRDDASRLASFVDTVAFTFDGVINVDLRGLERIDEDGVIMLIGLRRRLGRRLRIIPSESVARAVHYVVRSERNRREGGEDEQVPTRGAQR
jgi:ABC-type transporter Mla MlaB component